MTERLHSHFSLSCIGEVNGNPLQCSCLENPRDGGAWWAAVYGVAQSWTRLKRLSSSSIQYRVHLFYPIGSMSSLLFCYICSKFCYNGSVLFSLFFQYITLHAQYYVFFHHLFPSKNAIKTIKKIIWHCISCWIMTRKWRLHVLLCTDLFPFISFLPRLGGLVGFFMHQLVNSKWYYCWRCQKVLQSYNCLPLHLCLCTGEAFF